MRVALVIVAFALLYHPASSTSEPLQPPQLNKQEVHVAIEQSKVSVQPQAPEPSPVSAPVEVTAQTCGPQSPQTVYSEIRKAGLSRIAAIQLLGSWKAESGLDPCQQAGDGGLAWGLNSWHPGRRQDMPTDLEKQVAWAIHTEMPRDCRQCYEQLIAAQDAPTARDAIRRSTRWGVLGDRWQYADQYLAEIH